MTLNATLITEARWRRLPVELRGGLRRLLGQKSAIVDHTVLDIASALCERSAYDLALTFYDALEGEPEPIYHGCGVGILWRLRELMGERGPNPTGTLLV
jgi:hypothetical protein